MKGKPMPTINFTNATGSFTYEETAPVTPPTEPPPSETNTKGEVTQFNAANGSMIKVGGNQCEVEHDPSKSYSIANPDKYTLKFEVHSGDRWTSSGHTDPTTSERSEVEFWASRRAYGTPIAMEYGFVVHEGDANTSQWMVMGQWHSTSGGNPPFAVSMYGERMHVLIRDKSGKENRIFADTRDIQRGHKYNMRIELKFHQTSGYCRVWRDDEQIVNFTGAIGYASSDENYWKNGIYRNEAREVVAASYSNLHFG
jgi:hypothetical protein